MEKETTHIAHIEYTWRTIGYIGSIDRLSELHVAKT